MEIQRWEQNGSMRTGPDGEYVTYEDHDKSEAKAEDAAAKRAYRKFLPIVDDLQRKLNKAMYHLHGMGKYGSAPCVAEYADNDVKEINALRESEDSEFDQMLNTVDAWIETRGEMQREIDRLKVELAKANEEIERWYKRHPSGMSARQAARERLALDGADAQAIEGALCQVERELAEAQNDAHKQMAEAVNSERNAERARCVASIQAMIDAGDPASYCVAVCKATITAIEETTP